MSKEPNGLDNNFLNTNQMISLNLNKNQNKIPNHNDNKYEKKHNTKEVRELEGKFNQKNNLESINNINLNNNIINMNINNNININMNMNINNNINMDMKFNESKQEYDLKEKDFEDVEKLTNSKIICNIGYGGFSTVKLIYNNQQKTYFAMKVVSLFY
jgi:hypothetical protein